MCRKCDIIERYQDTPHGAEAAERVQEIWCLFERFDKFPQVQWFGFVPEVRADRQEGDDLDAEKHKGDGAHSPAKADVMN